MQFLICLNFISKSYSWWSILYEVSVGSDNDIIKSRGWVIGVSILQLFWNLAEVSATLLPCRLLNCQSGIKLFNTQSYGFDTLWHLNVGGPSYLGLTRPIWWLLMNWLLASPGHQQPWYWLCRMSYLRMDFNYLCHISVKEWHKSKYMFLFPLKNLARKGLKEHVLSDIVTDLDSYKGDVHWLKRNPK